MKPKDDTGRTGVPFRSLELLKNAKTSETLDAHFLVRKGHRRENSGLRVLHVAPMERGMSLLCHGSKVHDTLQLFPPTSVVQLIEHTPKKS